MEQPVHTPPADPSAALRAAIEARFFAPLDRPRTRRAGVELELPIYNLAPGAPNDFDAIHAAVADFLASLDAPPAVREALDWQRLKLEPPGARYAERVRAAFDGDFAAKALAHAKTVPA